MMSTGESKDIYCNMDIDSGGWTVILRRKDGSVNFVREWEDYKVGFGSLEGEFWAGNDLIHDLTTDGRNYSLRVDLESYDGEAIFAIYSSFSVGPESDNYRLHVGGYSSASTAKDSLSTHNNMMFSTKTRDNDIYSNNCAAKFDACWWFYKCHSSLLTGTYGKNLKFAQGITWKSDWGFNKFAKFATMMIRPN
ncbi:hypothetical protein LSH36_1054g00004 [Paralvinella palmiformis]|uniref:Fibrinogen C-terminal domain-containing protein n=1 Tax=Paralvinella palmiformis TaxID=53620 RepID=A0AAD9IVG7_9ANNE|nr:hypothetical protein LSH36_1054g00004 [Paralvinella palmiformis]